MMAHAPQSFAGDMWSSLGGTPERLDRLSIVGDGDLPSTFRVSDLAAAAIGVAGLSIAELIGLAAPQIPPVVVDRRLASFWFAWSIRPVGWTTPPAWDPIAGDYRTKDGWIQLHTNAPHHRAAVERILGRHSDKAAVAAVVASHSATELESAIVSAGGCAAEMRSLEEWAAHPQGRAVAAEPLVRVDTSFPSTDWRWRPRPERPLAGLRVLDLTRVLAGPIASRFLAGYGADVLRIDPPDWDEPGVVPEVTLGKRCARLDLHDAGDRRTFEALLAQADVLLHGYRAGALDRLGYDVAARQRIGPGLIDVSLNAYGSNGPWSSRRGFDSLVQRSAGIAHAGMRWQNVDMPIPLPLQALDHATGYLMAAAAVRAITRRLADGETRVAGLSLARTAKLLTDHARLEAPAPLAAEVDDDLAPDVEATAWGEARRLRVPVSVSGARIHWLLPARELGWAEPRWVGEVPA